MVSISESDANNLLDFSSWLVFGGLTAIFTAIVVFVGAGVGQYPPLVVGSLGIFFVFFGLSLRIITPLITSGE